MRYTLSNNELSMEIDSFGAELKSVKNLKAGNEYMWCADKKYWGRTSPVLFPFVGSLKNKSFLLEGKEYPMGQHGFARDMEFSLINKSDDEIWFMLESSEETMEKYPFAFELSIGYRLKEREIEVMWEVRNVGDKDLPFSIGAHPAFNCPVGTDSEKVGYSISFKKNGENLATVHHHGNTMDTGLSITEDLEIKLKDGKVKITEDFFDRCTYMIEDNQVDSVGLVDKNGKEYVTVLFDTPLFAIWSPEKKNAPFICIEPWYGRCDHVDFEGDVYERAYTNLLKAEEVFEGGYAMRFN